MYLTEFYNTLPNTLSRNKYEAASNYLNLGYRRITGRLAYNSPMPPSINQFIMEYGEAIALPNIFRGEVVGLLMRPVGKKTFRYYSELNIPYGAGVNNKPYSKPWVIVESCLDADFLRIFYPYVIATFGVTVSNFTQSFLFGTSPYIIAGFDNDEAGEHAYKKMYYKYKGRVQKLLPPYPNKDFGDTLQHLYDLDFSKYDLESSLIRNSLLGI